jgi:multipile epidermal growth factor-like domains protein 8
LTEPFGEISHGPNGSNYTQDSHCEWLIKAETRRFITLSFKLLHTECSYDYIFVYDGDSFHSPLLGSFSGKTEPQQIVASSGYVSEKLDISEATPNE